MLLLLLLPLLVTVVHTFINASAREHSLPANTAYGPPAAAGSSSVHTMLDGYVQAYMP